MADKLKDVDDLLFWDNRYKTNEFSWDLGKPTPYFVDWSTSIKNKSSKNILIPGCGLGHDAIFLSKCGFNVYACDFSDTALKVLSIKNKESNTNVKLISMDFFNLPGKYSNFFDFILEYTFYCAINPNKRSLYIENCNNLLNKDGKLIGIMLPIGNSSVSSNPPFKVSLNELKINFSVFFKLLKLVPNSLSVEKRRGIEYIVQYQKKNV